MNPISVIEIEAKLAAPSREVLEAIAARAEIAGFRAEARPLDRLETLYLDTPARALGAARVAVRIRRGPGGVELTVKRKGEDGGDVHRRPEWTVALPEVPEFPWGGNSTLAAELASIELDGPLAPLVETVVLRRPIDLRAVRGIVVVEIDLDEVAFRRPSPDEGELQSPPSFEVEIELRDGDETELGRVVDELCRDYPLEPMRLSKLERALRWAGLDR